MNYETTRIERKNHKHKQQRRMKKKSGLKNNVWLLSDGFKLQVSDNDKEIIECHKVTSLCNQAFVSSELEEFLDHYLGPNNDYWAVVNDRLVLRLEPCSLVPSDVVVLDANQRLSLGGVESTDILHFKRWNGCLNDINCSQIWVSVSCPPSYLNNSARTEYPENILELERIAHKKFLGHVMTKGQSLLLDPSRNDRRLSKKFDMKITDIIGHKGAKGELARGLIEKDTIIRFFPEDPMTAWITRTAPINTWRYNFNLSDLELELSYLGIGGLALQLKTILEGVFGPGSLPLPHSSILSSAHRKVKGILLYGAESTGKTFLANNIHNILGAPKPKFIKSYGSPKEVLSLFREAIRDDMMNRYWRLLGKKTGHNPLHIFIIENLDWHYMADEPSAYLIIKQRTSTLATLIDRLDNILLIGITRHIDRVQPNMFRAGRFELHVKFDLPNNSGRTDILKMLIRQLTLDGCLVKDDVDIQLIALWTCGYTHGRLKMLVATTEYKAMKRKTTSLRAMYNRDSDMITKETEVCMDDFYASLRDQSLKIICPLSTVITLWSKADEAINLN
ncbi:vesicular-fusion protein SEC18-like [Silene latifolia]|uniref:vesicular-fusion protein SEC18-like n=1 Tax=Silene latifolia TaxID=37657 RepID=UPI003D776721